MEEAISQAYARLTAHEFALEVMFANFVAAMPVEQADQFLSDYLNKSRMAWTSDPDGADNPDMDKMLADSIQMTEGFVDKVRKRTASIRKHVPS